MLKANSTGNYTCALSGLKTYKKYYVRAYAINSNGTAYGNEISFMSADIWRLQSVTTSTTPGIMPLINCIKAIGDNIYAGTTNGMYFSPDGGDSWRALGLTSMTVNAIGINDNALFAALSDGAIYRSGDRGQNWTNIRPAVAGKYAMDILIDDHYIYLTEYNGIYRSPDNGASWVNINPPNSVGPFSRLLKCSSTIYMPSETYTGLYKTNDNGTSWQKTTDLSFGVTSQFYPDIDCVGNKLLFGTGKGLCFSEDEGATWTKYNSLPTNYISVSVADKTIFCATNNTNEFNISYDSGNGWMSLTKEGFNFYGVINALICNKSIFIVSSPGQRLFRYRR